MLFGDYRIEIIPDTEFRLDGGAMFGVVPRVVWERVCSPDELNRIQLQMNCLFIETPHEKILIETGIGEKWTEKQLKMYGIFREKPFAQTLFEKTGYQPKDITIVVNTHLHFDHAGGNTITNLFRSFLMLVISFQNLNLNTLKIHTNEIERVIFPKTGTH